MAQGDATAADVPTKYDVVINGKGYVLLDSVSPSLPFRTHRAIYDITQTFLERQNVAGSYGDNTQDFFLTLSQNDWSLGESQRFLRPTGANSGDSVRRYWAGSNVDVSIPGQVALMPDYRSLTFAAAVNVSATDQINMWTASSTNLYRVAVDGTITDIGVHGAGGQPQSIAYDGAALYLTGAGNVRRYNVGGGSFSTFSATGATILAFVDNTLFGYVAGSGFGVYDTAGTFTVAFPKKSADGTVLGNAVRMVPFGGQVAILFNGSTPTGPELWVGDSTGAQRVAEFPNNFAAKDLVEHLGMLFVIGFEFNGARGYRTAIYYYANGNIGRLWVSPTYTTTSFGGMGITPWNGGLLFTDPVSSTIKFYDPGDGGVSTVAAWTNSNPSAAIRQTFNAGPTYGLLVTGTTTGQLFFHNTSIASSGYVETSLFDFDNSLTKVFRSVKVDYIPGSDGDGGSVDIAYQVDNLDGAYTTVQTGAANGTEYTISGTPTGRAISFKVTLNKGTSTYGPILKRIYVRAAPQLQQFRSGLYLLDCTNSQTQPRQLRDGTYHPLTGYEQVQNLLTAATTTTPFSVTDRVNGTYTGLVDLADSEGWDVYDVHPDPDNPAKPGAFIVRIKLRQV